MSSLVVYHRLSVSRFMAPCNAHVFSLNLHCQQPVKRLSWCLKGQVRSHSSYIGVSTNLERFLGCSECGIFPEDQDLELGLLVGICVALK